MVEKPQLILLDFGENLVISEQQQILLANFNGGTSIRRNQHPITGLNTSRDSVALLVKNAGSDGENIGLIKLLDILLRNEDARGSLSLSFSTTNQNSVQKRDNVLERLKSSRLWLVDAFVAHKKHTITDWLIT